MAKNQCVKKDLLELKIKYQSQEYSNTKMNLLNKYQTPHEKIKNQIIAVMKM